MRQRTAKQAKPAKPPRHLPAKRPASLASGTQFGQLMELLTRRRFTPNAALDGSPVGYWHGFPVEEAVTNGLMLVILDFAKKEDRAVATSEDVVAIAKRVDTLINAGLSVGYPNAEAAADAFVKKVVEPVHRAALMGFRPDASPPMAVWKEIVAGRAVQRPAASMPSGQTGIGDIGPFLGRPAALFFVRIINGALRHRARLEARLAELERYNLLRGPVTWISDSELDFARLAIRSLAAPAERPASIGKGFVRGRARGMSNRWGDWLETGAALAGCGKRIAQFRQCPVLLRSVPRGMQRTSVQEGWLDTLLLISIGRLKTESDILSLPGFWKAVSMYGETCRGDKGTRLLRGRILKTLKKRDAALAADALASISEWLDGAIEKAGAAFSAYEKMVSEMASVEREMAGLALFIKKCDTRLAKAKKGKEEIHGDRDSAADRLSRLQELHDLAKSEFRANYYPAIFLFETSQEEAFTGGDKSSF